MAGHGGGAWKVAYADFVTAMMAFFLVMWITSQSKPVKQAIAKYFKDPWKTSLKPTGDPGQGSPVLPWKKLSEMSGPSPIPSPNSGNSSGGQSPRNNVRAGKHGVVLDGDTKSKDKAVSSQSTLFAVHDGDRRCVGTLILFAEASSELDKDGKLRLTRFAREVRGKPYKIEIRGHATRRPGAHGGAPQDMWELSYARCLATSKFLEQQGIEPDRIRLSQGGAYEPFSINIDPEKQAFNSRVEVHMLSEYAEDLMGTPEERASRYISP